MDLMRLFMRIAQIARTRQPTWKVYVIAGVVALFVVVGFVEWMGWRPDWMQAHRVRAPRF